MSIHVRAADLPEDTARVGDTSFSTRAVYGNESSLMVATRPAGYHSRPHFHDCEQLNLVQSGAIWVFVGDRAFHVRTGDALRIPTGAVHWAWNRGDEPCTMVEVHAPGMQADPTVAGFATALFDDGEAPATTGSPVNTFLPAWSDFDPAVAERLSEPREALR